MGKLFFTSDLHLGHRNAINHTNRPFEDIEEMNETLIRNINRTVGPNDTLYILGDCSYRIGRDKTAELLRQIHCRDLHLVKGNHDKDLSDCGIFTEIADYKELKGPDNRWLILFHYPITDWNGVRHGSLHLHGHIHSVGSDYNLENFANQNWKYDVGVDANGFRPVSLDEIVALMR